jgi:dethiobiotin synthetase
LKSGVFITGTDTNVGKTICSALLAKALLTQGKKVGYWKPIQTGLDSDRKTVLELSGLSERDSPKSCYEFPEPMAPSRAAKMNGSTIELSKIRAYWNELPSDPFWIVEGAGGLLVPLYGRETIAELARALGLPLVIVASTRLGTMNHFLLTLEAARRRELEVLGVLWVGDEDPGLEASLDPWLSDIPWVRRVPRL